MTPLNLSPAGRRYGYIASPPDYRDLSLMAAPLTRKALPPSADLEPYCGPVFDQGQEGSCTANAGCGNLAYLYNRFKGLKVTFSRAFLYYQERALDGSLDQGDCGSTGRSSCKVMNQFGVCQDSDMPYVAGDFSTPPNPVQLAVAAHWPSGAYHTLHTVVDIKSCLASDYPVLVGFTVYSSFESQQVAETGIMPVPNKSSEQVLGGHEVLFIGYDDSRQAFKVRNSWGSNWGLSGNFWFPYAAAADPEILIDAWMQHLGKPW